MSQRHFASPDDVEAAFYDAIERGHLDEVMSVWAEDEDIVCIHPPGNRLLGYRAVRESWRAILAGTPGLRIVASQIIRWQSGMIAVHQVSEALHLGNDPQIHGPLNATNVYVMGAGGWRLVSHHSSAAGEAPAADLEISRRQLH